MARKSKLTTDAECEGLTFGDAARKTAVAGRPPRTTKRARLIGMLATSGGASIWEIGSALGWQPHTVRAALSALRKAGARIERIAQGASGDAARYRLIPNSGGRRMTAALSLLELDAMERRELLTCWQALFGTAAPRGMSSRSSAASSHSRSKPAARAADSALPRAARAGCRRGVEGHNFDPQTRRTTTARVERRHPCRRGDRGRLPLERRPAIARSRPSPARSPARTGRARGSSGSPRRTRDHEEAASSVAPSTPANPPRRASNRSSTRSMPSARPAPPTSPASAMRAGSWCPSATTMAASPAERWSGRRCTASRRYRCGPGRHGRRLQDRPPDPVARRLRQAGRAARCGKGVSFVSVTQAFNTRPMGRLTLNVLLSFAQFEREVTAERIRDKIAASKKKGLWMGGTVPLGYDATDRRRDAEDQGGGSPNRQGALRPLFGAPFNRDREAGGGKNRTAQTAE